jgi:dihydropteroate synthase
MGVLNLTPDSFSDGGKYPNQKTALKKVKQMIEDGADIIDIGGESTRPGSDRVEESVERERVMPVIAEIKKHFDIKISLDSYKYNIAKEALDLGIDYINDVTMLSDIRLAHLSKEYKVPIIIMHSMGGPKNIKHMQVDPTYSEKGVVSDVKSKLLEIATKAESEGAVEVILDPGIGFGKTVDHNIELIRNIDSLGNNGHRTLLGISRKSFIKKITGIENAEERDIETMAIHAHTYNNADIIRVHNVGLHRRMINIISRLTT